jgi:photosystem II stability/assembly factor-like uncharacterized protein
MGRSYHHAALTALSALALSGSAVVASAQQQQATVRAQDLRFQHMGPAVGGRIAAISGVPGDARIWYVGNASGGVWKSTDSGSTFVPVFDKQPVQAIGALAVSSSEPSQVWAGTGEAWAIRDADVMGDGIYLSPDAGATWKNMGLRETGRIGRIIVHPTNPKIVYVCALGRVTGPQEERGVYRTNDGGATWKRVLFVDQNTGCSGLSLDVKNPDVLFAGMWQVEMHTYGMFSGGPSSAVYSSRDGGESWTKLTAGLPKSPVGKIDVAVAPSDSKRVYALIQTKDQGSVWRSDDGGATWKVSSWNRGLIGRAGYYIRLGVSPANPDEVLVANSSFYRSMDGGKVFREMRWQGGDNHDIWFDPTNADRIGLSDDLGARVTTNHGKTFTSIALPNSQTYHVAVDTRVPYWIYTNRQDNGTMRGPSTLPEAGGRRPRPDPMARADSAARAAAPSDSAAARQRMLRADSVTADTSEAGGYGPSIPTTSTWEHGLGGCESGFTIPDLTDTDIVWATCYGNTVTRWNGKTKIARSVSPWNHTLDSPPNESKYRCHWTPPLALDPFDQKTVYYGCQVIFKSSNGGQSWKVISPDLSTQDPSRITSSGGLVGDNLGQFYGEVVFAIAPSKIQKGLIWAGTNDGLLWNTRDGGATWTNVTKNIAGMPTWGTIRKIEPSQFDAGTAYVAVDMHMMDDRKPYVFKTTDYGKTWTSVVGDLPASHPLDYVMAVAENPNRKGMLFAGTGHSFYYSLNDGAHWTKYTEGLPAAPVTWIEVPKTWRDVVVSTYGRGIYIMKDVTALEQVDKVAASEPVHLFPPHPGFRQPRDGHADITFSLAAATPKPVKLEIIDAAGALVRTLQVPTRAGYNRVGWDLRYETPKKVEMRTLAPDNPYIWDEVRFTGKDVRPVTHWGITMPQTTGPLAAPGRYAVRLTVDGKAYTQPLTILKDAEITSSDADLVASTKAQVRIRDATNAAVEMVNKIEVIRKQIEDQRKTSDGKAEVAAALDELDKKMLAVELQLLSRQDLNSDDKYFVEPFKIYMRLIWLGGEVGSGAGDVAGGAEYRPTDASLAFLEEVEKDLKAAKAAYEKLMRDEVPAFNRIMSGKVTTIASK